MGAGLKSMKERPIEWIIIEVYPLLQRTEVQMLERTMKRNCSCVCQSVCKPVVEWCRLERVVWYGCVRGSWKRKALCRSLELVRRRVPMPNRFLLRRPSLAAKLRLEALQMRLPHCQKTRQVPSWPQPSAAFFSPFTTH